jgi:nitrogen fixation protein NifQ
MGRHVNVRTVVDMHAAEPCAPRASALLASDAYRLLTGVAPDCIDVGDDDEFDRHVLASIVSIAVSEGGAVAPRVGLSARDLSELLKTHFPSSQLPPLNDPEGDADEAYRDEIEVVHEVLSANRSSGGDYGARLAAIVARRALEPNHLWEDLGLRGRSELTRLIARHFAPLAELNFKNMRWKRFIYRYMCEKDGFAMCTTPVCTSCADYELCFGEEKGLSRLTPGLES